MQIILNDQGYIESYALIGGLVDGIEIEAPDELLEDFKQHPEAYKLEDGVLVLDADKLKADADAAELTVIRRRRETECFAYINRGELWYIAYSQTSKKPSLQTGISLGSMRRRRGQSPHRRCGWINFKQQ